MMGGSWFWIKFCILQSDCATWGQCTIYRSVSKQYKDMRQPNVTTLTLPSLKAPRHPGRRVNLFLNCPGGWVEQNRKYRKEKRKKTFYRRKNDSISSTWKTPSPEKWCWLNLGVLEKPTGFTKASFRSRNCNCHAKHEEWCCSCRRKIPRSRRRREWFFFSQACGRTGNNAEEPITHHREPNPSALPAAAYQETKKGRWLGQTSRVNRNRKHNVRLTWQSQFLTWLLSRLGLWRQAVKKTTQSHFGAAG